MSTMNTTNTKIVVSRSNEDSYFLKKTDFQYIIYDKENLNSKYNIEKNKGNEASAYLKYIIDHYYHLDDYTIFIHCHDFSWHHDGSILELIHKNQNISHTFTNLNNCILGDMEDLDKSNGEIGVFFRKYIRPATGPYAIYPNFTSGVLGCAQFIVNKKNILMHSQLFYQQIYDWLLNTDIENRWSSRFLEWTWDLFWNKALNNIPIKKYLNENILDIHLMNHDHKDPAFVNDKKSEILKSLAKHDYYYVNNDELLLIIDHKTKYLCKNQFIYNKFL